MAETATGAALTHRVLIVLVPLALNHNPQPLGHVLDALQQESNAGGVSIVKLLV
jgi:hypothetical protein